MPITPLDIEEKEFKSSLFGYHRGEVDAFLEELGQEIQRLLKENHSLKDELKKKEKQLDRLLEEEAQIREAVISAQRLAQEIKDQARAEAELILKEARVEAERIRQEAERDREQLHQEIRELIKKKTQMMAELKGLLLGWLDLLDSSPKAEKEAQEFLDHPEEPRDREPAGEKVSQPEETEEIEEGPRLE
ncbi:DivIVA domain-containing protein [Thermosulfuriphilus sp.]